MENKNTIHILPNTSYIMSGPPCSGKSTFLKKLLEQGADPSAIVCPDTIREQILGAKPFVDDNGIGKSLYGWYYESDSVFTIAQSIVKSRLSQGLQVYVDATSLNDSTRKLFAEIFMNYNTPFKVLIFDEPAEVVSERLKKREYRFEQKQNIQNAVDKLQKDSIYPYEVINSSFEPLFVNALTSFKDFVVVGDTHGLLEPLVELLKKDDFQFDGTKFTHEYKRVLFLGDVVCRGKNSLELLDVVKNTISAGHGWMIKGNHEIQLIKAIDSLKIHNLLSPDTSISTTQTLKEFCSYSIEKQNEFFQFLRAVPYSLSFLINKETLNGENFDRKDDSQVRIAFGHSPLNYFNPTKTPGEELSYNQIPYEFDVQEGYEKGYLMAQNKYIYIHARHPNSEKFKATSTFSLADYESYNGNLVSFDLNAYLQNLKDNNFELSNDLFLQSIKKEPSNFNFTEKSKNQIALKNGISFLNKSGFFSKPAKDETHTHPMGFRMYVRKKMKESDSLLLEKCNGLVVDTAGEIIVNPRMELKNTLNLDNKELVYAVPHSNHNIFYIYKNPFNNKIELCGSKTFNSFKEDYEFLESKIELFEKYFENNNVTLGFETRLVEEGQAYEYVLTFAQRNTFKATPMSEETLDEIANQIQITRPIVQTTEIGEIRDFARDTLGLGYIVRKISNPSEIYYLPSDLVVFQTISEVLKEDNNARFFFSKPDLFINKFFTEDMKQVAFNIAKNNILAKFLKMDEDERKIAIFNSMHPEDKILEKEATARSLEKQKQQEHLNQTEDLLNIQINKP